MIRILGYNLGFLILFILILGIIFEAKLRAEKAFQTESVSAVGIPIFQKDLLHTYSHKPLSQAQNGYGTPPPKIQINNLGFRNNQDFESENLSKNILMLGDSFTFGTGLDQDKSFGVLIEKGLHNTHVWNAGVIGYSINNYRLQFRNLTPKINPDLVIFNIFVANDITELRRKKDVFKDEKLLRVEDQKIVVNNQQKLESIETKIPLSFAAHKLKEKWNILAYKNEWKLAQNTKPTLTWPVFLPKDHKAQDPHLPNYWARFETHLEAIKSFADTEKIPVLISLIPMDVQVDQSYESKYARLFFDQEARDAKRPQAKIKALCKDLALTCLDVLEDFQNHPQREKLYFSHNADPHFDLLGHQFYAELLQKAIIQHFPNF